MGIYDEDNESVAKPSIRNPLEFAPSQLASPAAIIALERSFTQGLSQDNAQDRREALERWVESATNYLKESDPGKARRMPDTQAETLITRLHNTVTRHLQPSLTP